MTIDSVGNKHDSKGRFAGHVSGESDVSLLEDVAANNEYWEEKTGLSLGDIQEACDRLAEYHRRANPNIDVGEFSGDTMVKFLELADKRDKPVENPRALLKTIAKGLGSHKAFGTTRGPDISAMKTYLNARNEWAQQHGTMMTPAQEDLLANTIRDSMIADGKQAPTKDFHRRVTDSSVTSMNAMMEDSEGGSREILLGEARHHSDYDLGDEARDNSAFDEAQDQLDDIEAKYAASKPRTAKARAEQAQAHEADMAVVRAQMWDRMASTYDLPSVRKHTQTQVDADENAEYVRGQGGAAELADRIAAGGGTRTQRAAFAAPWGGQECSDRDLEVIAEAMTARRAYAQDIWDSANSASIGTQAQVDAGRTTNSKSAEQARTRLALRFRKDRQIVASAGGCHRTLAKIMSQKSSPDLTRAFMAPWKDASLEARSSAIKEMRRLGTPEAIQKYWVDAYARAGAQHG